MTDKEKIRQEIERRREKYRTSRDFIDAIRCTTCTEILSFIDSLPEEKKPIREYVSVSENLEKEIKDIQQDYKENGCNFDGDIDFIARHFANWQKELMMKDAVDAEASYTMSVPSILISLPIGIKVSDKVKVIIIKQENKNE